MAGPQVMHPPPPSLVVLMEVQVRMWVQVDDAIVNVGVLVDEVDREEQVQVGEDVVPRALGGDGVVFG